MSEFANRVCKLVIEGELRISEHGYDELADDSLTVKEIIDGIKEYRVVEEYPNYPKGPCVLLLQKDCQGNPVHTVWGIPKGFEKPVVLVTAYRSDQDRWDETFMRRRY